MPRAVARQLLLALLAQPWVASACAQGETSIVEVMRANLEPAYFVVPIAFSGLDPVWYEANVVAHFTMHRESWPFALVLSPKVVVRLFRQWSEPIKTPSYMPQLALFFWANGHDKHSRASRYASFALKHHSNGQAGPAFLPGGELNHENGDFFTSAIELALHAFDSERRFFPWMRAALEWHPPIAQHIALAGRYSSLRLQLEATVLDQPSFGGKLRASLGALLGSFDYNEDPRVVRLLEHFPLSVSYSLTPEGSDLAAFARYYFGRDYYNIWFDRNLHVLQVGLSSQVQ